MHKSKSFAAILKKKTFLSQYTKKDPDKAENYRPISKRRALSKNLKSCFTDRLMSIY